MTGNNLYKLNVQYMLKKMIWAKLSKADQVAAFYSIDKYTKYLKTKESWRSKADPEKYLKDRYWENEWK